MKLKKFASFKIIIGIELITVVVIVAIFYLYWNLHSYYLFGRYNREATEQEEKQFSNIVNSYNGNLKVALISPFDPFAVESISKTNCKKLSADLAKLDFLSVSGCIQKRVLSNAGDPVSTDK